MNMPVLTEIQQSINRLSSDEQLWLIEWLAHRVRQKANAQSVWESQLADMAADPDIQSELRQIETEFTFAEADGLEATS